MRLKYQRMILVKVVTAIPVKSCAQVKIVHFLTRLGTVKKFTKKGHVVQISIVQDFNGKRRKMAEEARLSSAAPKGRIRSGLELR